MGLARGLWGRDPRASLALLRDAPAAVTVPAVPPRAAPGAVPPVYAEVPLPRAGCTQRCLCRERGPRRCLGQHGAGCPGAGSEAAIGVPAGRGGYGACGGRGGIGRAGGSGGAGGSGNIWARRGPIRSWSRAIRSSSWPARPYSTSAGFRERVARPRPGIWGPTENSPPRDSGGLVSRGPRLVSRRPCLILRGPDLIARGPDLILRGRGLVPWVRVGSRARPVCSHARSACLAGLVPGTAALIPAAAGLGPLTGGPRRRPRALR